MHITPACGHAGIPGQPGLHDRFQSSWLHSETHPVTFQKEKKKHETVSISDSTQATSIIILYESGRSFCFLLD